MFLCSIYLCIFLLFLIVYLLCLFLIRFRFRRRVSSRRNSFVRFRFLNLVCVVYWFWLVLDYCICSILFWFYLVFFVVFCVWFLGFVRSACSTRSFLSRRSCLVFCCSIFVCLCVCLCCCLVWWLWCWVVCLGCCLSLSLCVFVCVFELMLCVVMLCSSVMNCDGVLCVLCVWVWWWWLWMLLFVCVWILVFVCVCVDCVCVGVEIARWRARVESGRASGGEAREWRYCDGDDCGWWCWILMMLIKFCDDVFGVLFVLVWECGWCFVYGVDEGAY